MRRDTLQRWLPFLFLLAVTLIMTGPYLLPGRALMARHTDCYQPWRAQAEVAERERAESTANRLLTDKLLMFHPEVHLTREAIESGRLPTWNPYVLGGLPHIATGIPAAFSPTMALHNLFNPFTAYGLGAAVHMLFAGMFMYLFLRRFNLLKWSALFGATAFAFGGWMAARMEYYQIAGAAAWVPMALYGVEMTLATGRWRNGVFLALGLGLSLLSGFPQISIEAMYFIAAYALARMPALIQSLGTAPALRRILLCALASGIGLLIAAPQMVPSALFAFSGSSTRALADFDPIRLRSLDPRALSVFLTPSILGHSFLPDWAASPYNPSRSLLGEAWLGHYSSFTEVSVYMGIFAICLVLGFPRLWRSRRGFFLMLAGLAGVLASCDTFLLKLCYHLPGLNIGDPKRFLFITVLALSILAALAIDRHLRLPMEGRNSFGPAMVGLGLGVAVAAGALWLQAGSRCEDFLLAGLTKRFGVSREQALDVIGRKGMVDAAWHLMLCLWTLAGTAFAAGCVLLASGWKQSPGLLRTVSPLLFLVLELCFFAHGANEAQVMEGFYRKTPMVHFLQERLEADGPFRIVRFRDADVGPDAIFPPKLPMIAGIEDVQGYVAIYLKRYRDLIDGLEEGLTESVGMRSLKKAASLEAPLLDLLGARFVLCKEPPDPLPAKFRSVRSFDGVTVIENTSVLPRAFVVRRVRCVERPEEALEAVLEEDFHPGTEAVIEGRLALTNLEGNDTDLSKATITRRGISEVEVAVESGGGLLVLTENHAAGWTAEVDGEPAPLFFTDYAFRGVPVPPGVHTVVFRYRSTPIIAGLLLGVVGMAALFVLVLKGSRNRATRMPVRSRLDLEA